VYGTCYATYLCLNLLLILYMNLESEYESGIWNLCIEIQSDLYLKPSVMCG
jgi:hypothetical protein